MTSAVVLSDCKGCDDAAEYLRRLRSQRGAHLAVRCDECGATLESRRAPRAAPAPRPPSPEAPANRGASR